MKIDWSARTVHVASHVVLREGPLEFFACFAGKEHESILRFDATAAHIYMAMGLIGLEPGHPPRWNEPRGTYDDPAGALVDITLKWDHAGQTQRADAADWLREVEYERVPHARPWIFAGSLMLSDGTLSADASGVGIALVDFPDSLISYSRRYPSRYGALWAAANTPAIPPKNTAVQLIIRAATPRDLDVCLDARGAAHLNGRYCEPADLVDVLRLNHRLAPRGCQEIVVVGTLRTDLRAWRQRLRAARLPAAAFRFARDQSESSAD